VALYLDGKPVQTTEFAGRVATHNTLILGGRSDGADAYEGQILSVRYENRSVSPATE
jgi:hypothetical protein